MNTIPMSETEGHSPSGRERRRHRRVTTDLPVMISLPEGQHEARLRDLSQAGVCFFLDRRIPEMTVLGMQLDLPNGDGSMEVIRGSGVVVRCEAVSPHLDHYEVAVFLNSLTEDCRDRLNAYVETYGS